MIYKTGLWDVRTRKEVVGPDPKVDPAIFEIHFRQMGRGQQEAYMRSCRTALLIEDIRESRQNSSARP